MKDYKHIIIRFIALVFLLIGVNYFYKYFMLENDLQTHSPNINLVRAVVKKNAEVIYLGESSNNTFRADDIDKRNISEFISDYYPSINLGTITKEASHSGVYYELLNNIPEDSKVKTVIVTMNLRSFNAGWIYSNLETPIQKALILLKNYPPLFNRLMLSFKAYDIKTDEEREKQVQSTWENEILKFPHDFKYKNVIDWNKGMAESGIKNSDGSINSPLTELACHYIKTYAFQINEQTNPRIRDFDKIVELAKKRNWNLVFNILAENTFKADSLVGKELTDIIRANRDLLYKRYNKGNVLVVDNLEKVPDIEYIDRTWTTEHYAENGRKIIARNVAETLKKFYPGKFKNIVYSNQKPSEFFNDCEGKTIWSQMGTLTQEKYFEGEKSSKTGQGQNWSLTFEYPIKNLPDSLKTLTVDFQLYQNNISPDSKLVMEVSGKNVEIQWRDVKIQTMTNTSGKWVPIHYIYNLDSNFYNADIVKVYVLNISDIPVYVDNVKLKFNK